MAERNLYMGCTGDCGWRGYRSQQNGKPCPSCGAKVTLIGKRRKGTTGPRPGRLRHGTRHGYQQGCRCPRCVKTERAYQRERYQARQRAKLRRATR